MVVEIICGIPLGIWIHDVLKSSYNTNVTINECLTDIKNIKHKINI